MNLVVDIAWTHIAARLRQTVVAVLGVSIGVGFSIMMAALMQGSQEDFVRTLVNAMPHVAINDERREAPRQPAEEAFDTAQIRGLTPATRRRGINNPIATIAALESWVPGAVTPSVQARGILRYGGKDVTSVIVGIDPAREPRVSQLVNHLRQGSLPALYRATNAIILGDRLAEKLGARLGSNISMSAGTGKVMTGQVVGIFRSGVRAVDEGTSYVLIKTAQILAEQTGLINEIRIRLNDPMNAKAVADRIIADTGLKTVSWQEANEDLMSAFVIRNIIMYTVVGAILLVASFGTYNIISTITFEKSRDIAIMKSLGLTQSTVRRIFILEGLVIGLAGALAGSVLGFALTQVMLSIEIRTGFTDATRLPLIVAPLHYVIAGGIALASSAIAGFFPARKAARVHPVEIIRGAT
jgi:lipoprotein-releasing system permease protein